jgi:metal-responsive CopG/Arc/MetJ family transcriptional regulator
MKTAISIPDRVFKKAERSAKKHGLSRSRFYANAVEKYLEVIDQEAVTRKLDAVYSKVKADTGALGLQRLNFEKQYGNDDW